jgi:hypothetical protein
MTFGSQEECFRRGAVDSQPFTSTTRTMYDTAWNTRQIVVERNLEFLP